MSAPPGWVWSVGRRGCLTVPPVEPAFGLFDFLERHRAAEDHLRDLFR
jgi:hypothetical protein